MAHTIETAQRTSGGASRLAILDAIDDRVLVRIEVRSDDRGNTTISVQNNEGRILVRPEMANTVVLLTDRH